jgi:hypothetical protein
MSVQHVLIACPKWRAIRDSELSEFGGDIRQILNIKEGATSSGKDDLKNRAP